MRRRLSCLRLGTLCLILLLACEAASATGVLVRAESASGPELSSIQTYSGKAEPIITPVKPASSLTVVLLLDGLSPAALEGVSKDLLTLRPGKKALVVFTDGDDNSSMLNANAAVTRAKKAGIPIYAIAEGEATHSANLKKLLEELSTRTGGTSYEVKKLNDVDTVFQKIALDLQHLYMLTYLPAKTEESKWKKIEVSLQGGKEYRVRAKEGYFPN